jgi:hypothetical protein
MWINKKWKEGFHLTSMATDDAWNRWGNPGYAAQVTYLPEIISFLRIQQAVFCSFFLQYIIWNDYHVFRCVHSKRNKHNF